MTATPIITAMVATSGNIIKETPVIVKQVISIYLIAFSDYIV
jgi:hypothetical protein